MDPFLISLGLQNASAVGSWWMAREKGSQIRAETEENVRRFKLQAAGEVSQAQLAGAASGIELDSLSLTNVITTMEQEYQRQAEWMRQAGLAKASAAELGGSIGLVGDFGSSMFSYGRNAGWGKG